MRTEGFEHTTLPNVLYWVSYFPMVSETFIFNQVLGTARAGAEVFVVCNLYKPENLEHMRMSETVDWTNRVFKKPSKSSKKNNIFQFLRSFFNVLSSKRIVQTRCIRNVWKHRKNSSVLKLIFILEFILNNEVEVIHAHFGPNGVEASKLFDFGFECELITTFHGYDIRMGQEVPGMYKVLFDKSFKVISISSFNSENLVSFGLDSSKLVEIPNGIDTEFFNLKEFPVNQIIRFISVARLVNEKAIDIAIKALELFYDSNPEQDFIYDIIGEGYLRNELEELLETSPIKDRVNLLGAKNSEQVRDAMQASDVFLLSSIEEALPTVLSEAQSCGLPILATDVGAVKNMLKDAVIVDANSVLAFKDGLEKIIQNRDQWNEIGIKGRNNVIQNFNSDAISRKLTQLYSQTISLT